MKYRNLFFDLDDTIWAFSRNARDTFEEAIGNIHSNVILIRSIIIIRFISNGIPNSGLNMVRGR